LVMAIWTFVSITNQRFDRDGLRIHVTSLHFGMRRYWLTLHSRDQVQIHRLTKFLMRILTINYFSLHSRKNQSVASRCKLWFRGQYLVCFGSFRSKMLRKSQYCKIFVGFLLSNDVIRGSLGCLGCTRLIDKQSRCVNYFGTAFFGFVAWKQTAFLLMTNLPIFIEWIENPILLNISYDCKNISFFVEKSRMFRFMYCFEPSRNY
jgi:hypothetical protein